MQGKQERRRAASRGGLVLGFALLIGQASCDGCGGDDQPTPALRSISVTPQGATVTVGASITFTATLTYQGAPPPVRPPVEWSVSDPAMASIDAQGSVSGRMPGIVAVTARSGDVSGSAQLTVMAVAPARTLTAVALQPASVTLKQGKTMTLTATGGYSDGSQEDVTTRASWSSASPQIASVSAAGTVTAVSAGTAMVSAALDGQSSAATITVTPPVLVALSITPPDLQLPLGDTHRYTATASYDDASSKDVTASVTWTSSQPDVAAVSSEPGAAGQVTALALGTTTIGASFQGLAASVALAIRPAVVDLALDPPAASIAPGSTLRLSARGLFSDGGVRDLDGQVSWQSSSASVVRVDASGRVTGLALGSATITARAGKLDRSTTITVSPTPLVSMAFQSGHFLLAPQGVRSLSLVGVFADGTTQDLTDSAEWTSAMPAIATVTSTEGSRGQLRGQAIGRTSVTASFGGRTATATVTVTPALPTNLSIVPPAIQLARGTTAALRALARFPDGSSEDITEQVTWTTSSAAIAAPSVGRNGPAVVGLAPGHAVVTARAGTLTAMAPIAVTGAALNGLSVTPADVRLARGTASYLRAEGQFSDGSTQDVTADVFWSAANPMLASVSNAPRSLGLARALQAGSTDVAVRLMGVSGTSRLQVTGATPTAILVSPENLTIARGLERAFVATATFSDGSTQVLAGEALWTTTDQIRLVVSNVAGSTGTATAMTEGPATITTSFGGVSGSTAVNVTAAAAARLVVTPAESEIPRGGTIDLRATVEYSDGATQDVTTQATWESGAPGVASVSTDPGSVGRVTGNLAGGVTITVTLGGVLGFATVRVTP